MGFLDSKDGNRSSKPQYELEVTNVSKNVRPLSDKPTPVWGHSIPGIDTVGPDGKPLNIRRYQFFMCTSTSRSGAGCVGCTTQDPMWDRLDAQSKLNKKGNRVDFPKKCVHLMPVLEVATQQVKLLKGGNGTYKVMDTWYGNQAEGQKDLRRCEWSINKTGLGKMTQYNVDRLDATPFTATDSMLAEAAEVVRKGMMDMAPPPPEKFMQLASPDAKTPVVPPVSLPGPDLSQGSTFVNAPFGSQLPPVAFVTGLSVVTPPQSSGALPTTTFTQAPTPAPDAPVSVPTVNPVPAGTLSVVAEFTAWLNQQAEFKNIGIVQNLVPILKKVTGGDINYQKCTPEQIATLRTALEAKLTELRTKKA